MDNHQETSTLIAGRKVSETSVFNSAGENIGEIHDLMIDKVSGKVAYAVMSFGGFLGIGERYHPIPWSLLKYDPGLGGYVVDIPHSQLEGAPVYQDGELPDRDSEARLHAYYSSEPYWLSPV